MTAYRSRAIIVVAASVAVAANNAAKRAHLEGRADLTWGGAGLSPTGQPPATHYWCNWQFRPEVLQALKMLIIALPPSVRNAIQIFELNSWDPEIAKPTPDEVLGLVGLQRIQNPMNALG